MGPLSGMKIVEMGGIGPAPFCGMLLADLGADVIRIDRHSVEDLGIPIEPKFDLLNRGKRSVAVDLKSKEGRDLVLSLIAEADGLIEGFRPGVMERLGLGPDECAAANPRLVFGRMTGWGQTGPLANNAGHDANYIALTGALHAIGRADDRPVPPLNLVGDFGGGALYLAVGLLAGLLEAKNSGRGQVIDAAMVDGATHLMTLFYGLMQMGEWKDERETNFIDGGAFYYDTYETKDGKHIVIGAIENRFYAQLLELAGIDPSELPNRGKRELWPEGRAKLAEVFRRKTRDEWAEIFDGSDACLSPVLSLDEARDNPHLKSRDAFVTVDDVWQPAPAPRFSRTPGGIRKSPPAPGQDGAAAMRDWGVAGERISALAKDGVIHCSDLEAERTA